MPQSQPLRIENPHFGSFGTCRTIQSRLWFINNPRLEDRCLGYLAKYRQKYGAKLYGFVFSGSHFHALMQFPDSNRASFYRDLNARAAEAVRRHVWTPRDTDSAGEGGGVGHAAGAHRPGAAPGGGELTC